MNKLKKYNDEHKLFLSFHDIMFEASFVIVTNKEGEK
jgi:hypothetical protein